jgi:hypothetical protein
MTDEASDPNGVDLAVELDDARVGVAINHIHAKDGTNGGKAKHDLTVVGSATTQLHGNSAFQPVGNQSQPSTLERT